MISIDYTDRSPIYEQIVSKIENLIVLGVLKPDEKLPSVRSLGIELSTNPNTIQKAYQVLETKGIVYSVKGIGNFVSNFDLKSQKLDDIYNQILENYKTAVAFGLNSENFATWQEKLKEKLYDNSK